MAQELYKLPEGWEWKRLTHKTESERKAINPTADETYNYIGLENIESHTGRLMDFQPTSGRTISSLKTRFKEGSVLYGKLRPYLNKVMVAPFDGIATTEIYPFLPKPDLSARYLAAFMRSEYFVSQANNSCSGARMPRVTTKFFKEIQIPLPPLEEQKRIVAQLDNRFSRIDQSIAQLQHTQAQTKALWASALDAAFDQCRSDYKTVPISEAANVARGKSKHRPRNDKALFGGDYPFIQTGDVSGAHKYITSFSTTYNEKGLAQSKLWNKGTICLTIAANIGDVAILGLDACFPDSVVGIRSNKNSNEFLFYFLKTLQQQLDRKANSAAQKNINLKILESIEIPLPPLPEQEKIVAQLDAIAERTQALEAATTRQLGQLQALKASLLDGAFRGQL